MDRWDERPSHTDSGNGVSNEDNQNLSGARSGCQLAHCCWGYPPQGCGLDCALMDSCDYLEWSLAAAIGITTCLLCCSQVNQVSGAQVSARPRPWRLASVRGLARARILLLLIGRWWWFLSAAAWHALLRAASLGVDAVASIVIMEGCSSRLEVRLFSPESWRSCRGAGSWSESFSSKHRFGALLSRLECMGFTLACFAAGNDVDAVLCCPASRVESHPQSTCSSEEWMLKRVL